MGIGAVAGAVIGGVSSIVSGNRAADAQEAASSASIAENRRQYDQTRADFEGQRRAGDNALAVRQGALGIGAAPVFGYGGKQQFLVGDGNGGFNVQNGNGLVWENFDTFEDGQAFMADNATTFETSPGYEFRAEQSQNALERMASARGLRLGSSTLQEAQRMSDGLASAEYTNWMNQLGGHAGIGQSANNTLASVGQSTATNNSNALAAAGDARASGYLNTNSAIQGTLGNFSSIYGMGQAGAFGSDPWSGFGFGGS